jgi:hypothetical protein
MLRKRGMIEQRVSGGILWCVLGRGCGVDCWVDK